LQALASWRDEKARKLDKPRNRIASEAQLQLLAEKQPQSEEDFSNIEEIALGWVKRHGQEVIDAIKQALNIPEALLPVPLSSPRSPEYKATRKQLKKALADLANQLEVPVELLAKRKQIDEWLQALTQKQLPEVPENWPAWRRTAIEKLTKHLLLVEGEK